MLPAVTCAVTFLPPPTCATWITPLPACGAPAFYRLPVRDIPPASFLPFCTRLRSLRLLPACTAGLLRSRFFRFACLPFWFHVLDFTLSGHTADFTCLRSTHRSTTTYLPAPLLVLPASTTCLRSGSYLPTCTAPHLLLPATLPAVSSWDSGLPFLSRLPFLPRSRSCTCGSASTWILLRLARAFCACLPAGSRRSHAVAPRIYLRSGSATSTTLFSAVTCHCTALSRGSLPFLDSAACTCLCLPHFVLLLRSDSVDTDFRHRTTGLPRLLRFCRMDAAFLPAITVKLVPAHLVLVHSPHFACGSLVSFWIGFCHCAVLTPAPLPLPLLRVLQLLRILRSFCVLFRVHLHLFCVYAVTVLPPLHAINAWISGFLVLPLRRVYCYRRCTVLPAPALGLPPPRPFCLRLPAFAKGGCAMRALHRSRSPDFLLPTVSAAVLFTVWVAWFCCRFCVSACLGATVLLSTMRFVLRFCRTVLILPPQTLLHCRLYCSITVLPTATCVTGSTFLPFYWIHFLTTCTYLYHLLSGAFVFYRVPPYALVWTFFLRILCRSVPHRRLALLQFAFPATVTAVTVTCGFCTYRLRYYVFCRLYCLLPPTTATAAADALHCAAAPAWFFRFCHPRFYFLRRLPALPQIVLYTAVSTYGSAVPDILWFGYTCWIGSAPLWFSRSGSFVHHAHHCLLPRFCLLCLPPAPPGFLLHCCTRHAFKVLCLLPRLPPAGFLRSSFATCAYAHSPPAFTVLVLFLPLPSACHKTHHTFAYLYHTACACTCGSAAALLVAYCAAHCTIPFCTAAAAAAWICLPFWF